MVTCLFVQAGLLPGLPFTPQKFPVYKIFSIFNSRCSRDQECFGHVYQDRSCGLIYRSSGHNQVISTAEPNCLFVKGKHRWFKESNQNNYSTLKKILQVVIRQITVLFARLHSGKLCWPLSIPISYEGISSCNPSI